MKALINPSQNYLVVEVSKNEFEVASPLTWIDCPDTIIAYEYKYIDGKFVKYTPPIYIPTENDNKITAITLLKETDWAELPSVSNPAESNPYLNNKDDFIVYRSKIREIAVNPIDGNIDWPIMPQGDWIKL